MDQPWKRLREEKTSVFDAVAVGICGIDTAGRVMLANTAALRMLGHSLDELLGRSHHEIFRCSARDGTPLERLQCPLEQALREERPCHLPEVSFRKRDGTSIPVECTMVPLKEDGAPAGAVISFRDMTERRNLQTQLVRAQKLESIGQLAAGIAHEINTPIQYVGDNVRFLQEALADLGGAIEKVQKLVEMASADGQHQELLEQMNKISAEADLTYLTEEIPIAIEQSLEGIERVATIVRAMKDFSHPAATEKKPIDLHRAIESTYTIARNEWKYVADLVTDFDPAMPWVPCLPGEFNQVILNLIINAAHAIAEVVKEGESKGRITITTRFDGVCAEIRIQDTGTGIPEEHRAKIFDLFFTTKEVGKGTGQGLSFAHSVICDKHDGTITFETEIGKGTTFIIRVPVKPPSVKGAENIEQEAHSLCR